MIDEEKRRNCYAVSCKSVCSRLTDTAIEYGINIVFLNVLQTEALTFRKFADAHYNRKYVIAEGNKAILCHFLMCLRQSVLA